MANINVPQQDGEITISYDGGDPVVYEVKDGVVEVDDDLALRFLGSVPGAEAPEIRPAPEVIVADPEPVAAQPVSEQQDVAPTGDEQDPSLEGDDGSKQDHEESNPDDK